MLYEVITVIESADSGLPIGNYTSQWFANFYLQDLDHFIKEKLNVTHYVRYVDDIVILGGNKKVLHQVNLKIEEFLQEKNLTIKKNWQVFLVRKRFIVITSYSIHYTKLYEHSLKSSTMRR